MYTNQKEQNLPQHECNRVTVTSYYIGRKKIMLEIDSLRDTRRAAH